MRQRHDLNDKSIGTELRPGKPQGTGRGLDGNTSQPSNTVGDGVTFSLRTESGEKGQDLNHKFFLFSQVDMLLN
jgi:hypothetical protein